MGKIALHWQIIIGLVLGVVWALLSSALGWSEFTADWIAPFGKIFINLLKLIALPLVLFSIIKGIGDLEDIGRLGKMGLKTLGLYVGSTVLAITVGLVLVNVIQPGQFVDENQRVVNRMNYELWANETEGVEILDGQYYLENTEFAAQRAEAMELYGAEEVDAKIEGKVSTVSNREDGTPLQFLVDMVPSNIFSALGSNSLMLQIIFFALFFGTVLLLVDRDKAMPVKKLIDGLNEVFLKMVDVIMLAAPYFVFALLAGKIGEMAGDDPNKVVEIFVGLGMYSLVVVAGLGFLVFLVYPIVASAISKIGYGNFFKGMGKAQMLAFSTSSSAATLPVTMDCVNDNLGVSKEVSSFVLPIGATVNMDGTSLYISVAVVFLAQFHLIDLTIAQQLTIVLTATLASIGASAVPSAGLIMMIMVLQSVGLNPAWIAIIFPVDRILDMCRTVVNVTGDATVCTIIAKSENELNNPQNLSETT